MKKAAPEGGKDVCNMGTLGTYLVFGQEDTERYVLAPDIAQKAKLAIIKALKDELPEEARRVDVICHLFDEMKRWTETQHLIL